MSSPIPSQLMPPPAPRVVPVKIVFSQVNQVTSEQWREQYLRQMPPKQIQQMLPKKMSPDQLNKMTPEQWREQCHLPHMQQYQRGLMSPKEIQHALRQQAYIQQQWQQLGVVVDLGNR